MRSYKELVFVFKIAIGTQILETFYPIHSLLTGDNELRPLRQLGEQQPATDCKSSGFEFKNNLCHLPGLTSCTLYNLVSKYVGGENSGNLIKG